MNKIIHNNWSEYNNLAHYLLSMDVPPYKIEQSKKDMVEKKEECEELALCYDFISTEEAPIKVPVNNIYDIAREGITNHNVSWYDHMNYSLFGISEQFKNGLITRKFEALFNRYKGNSYSKLVELFQDGDSELSIHYFSAYEHPNMPTKYYQRGDGSHRLSMAKVMGVNYLYGISTEIYKLNENKYKYFQNIKSLLKNLYVLLDRIPLFEYNHSANYISFNSEFISATQHSTFNWKVYINREAYTELDLFINNLESIIDTLTKLDDEVDFNNNKYLYHSKIRMLLRRYYYHSRNHYILSDFHNKKEEFIDFVLFNIAHK